MMRHERENDADLLRYLNALRNSVGQSRHAEFTYDGEEGKESRPIFRAIFENAADGILLVDAESKRLYLGNRVVCQMLGYDQQELQTLEIGDIHPEKDLPYITEQFKKQVRGDMILARDIPVKRKDGSVFYADINGFPISLGPKTYLISIFRDITERRNTEETIRRSEEQFRGIFENTAVGMYRTTPDGRILMANPALVRMLGYSSFEELARRNLEKEGYEPQYARSVFKERIEKEGEVTGLESAWVRKDGTILTIIENTRAVRDEHGNTLYYEGTAEDITERKKAEEALKQSEEQWRSLTQTAPDVIMMADLDGCILFANHVVAPLTVDAVIGTSLYDYMPCDYQTIMRNTIKQVVQTGKSCIYELAGTGPGGQMAWYQSHVGPVKRDDQVIGVTIISRDITEQKAMEQALRNREQQYRSVVDDSPGLLCSFLPDGTIDFVNAAYCHYFGKTCEELVGSPFASLIPEKDRKAVLDRILSLTVDSPTVTNEHRVLGPDGQVRWNRWTNRALFDEQGRAVLFQSFGEDITDRKTMEIALAESEEKYKAIVEGSGDIIKTVDRDGVLLFVNTAAAKYLGGTPEDFVGKTVWDVFSKEMADRRMAEVSEVIRTKQQMEFVRQVDMNGQLEWHHSRIRPITYELKDVTIAMVITRDIDRMKHAEEQNRTLGSAVEQSMDGIAIGDLERRLRYVNAAYARMHGYTPEEMVGMKVSDVHNMKGQHEYEGIIHLIDAHESWVGEVEHVRKDGTVFPCFLSATRTMNNDGEITGRLVVCRDVTEFRKREKEIATYREKMAHAERLVSLGTLSATVVHQLTQPLTVIRLSLDNVVDELEGTSCSSTVLRRLRDSVAQVSNITAIIKRFRNFARQSSDTDFGQVNVHAVAVRVARLLTESAKKARVRLDVEDLSELPPVILHEREFEQILFALIENAIQAADGEDVRRIVISGHAKDEHIELRFTDNCGGIAPENLDRIFEPFFTTKPRGQGTGLGLCIVRDAVARVGGRVRVESEFGKGSIFFVTLPIDDN